VGYTLLREEQSGALPRLDDIGALAEIEEAVLRHCASQAPLPRYQPQEIKRHLKPKGWEVERRVPMYSAWIEAQAVRQPNDRYDLLKFFIEGKRRIGVAIEIEDWEIQNDLLKFRRGVARGQIDIGVLLHPHESALRYVFDHVRLLTEPLFADLPIAFIAPLGPGLKPHQEKQAPTHSPYLFPWS
jgi:hypothetical protein